MLNNLPRCLRSPVFEDGQKSYAAQILNLIMLVGWVAITCRVSSGGIRISGMKSYVVI